MQRGCSPFVSNSSHPRSLETASISKLLRGLLVTWLKDMGIRFSTAMTLLMSARGGSLCISAADMQSNKAGTELWSNVEGRAALNWSSEQASRNQLKHAKHRSLCRKMEVHVQKLKQT